MYDAVVPAIPDAVGLFFENAFGDKYLFSVNRDVFDRIGAAGVFKTHFAESLSKENTLYVVVGTDSGLMPKYIAEKGNPTGSRYIFLELPIILDALIKEGVLDLENEHHAYITLDQWHKVSADFKIVDYFYIEGVAFLRSFAAQDAHFADYAELSWQLDEKLQQLRWDVSAQLGHETFIDCQLHNLAENILPATPLKGVFQGATAVLLAGGPSLDECLPWVMANRKKLVLLAVSRISRRLREVGLAPDFVFSVDPTELSFDVSKEMLELPDSVVLICANHITPLLQGCWPGLCLYLGGLLPWESKLNATSLPQPGPTVTNTALSVAHSMGFAKIVLAGVDLCFTRDGYTHAKGSNEHQVGPRFDLTALQVDTNGGWKASTTHDLVSAIQSIGWQARAITADGVELINPSAGAAKIDSVTHQNLANIALPDEPVDVKSRVTAVIQESTGVSRVAHCRRLIKDFAKARYHVEAIHRLAKEALGCNERMYEGEFITDVAAKRRMDRIERELTRKHRYFTRLITVMGIREFLKITRPFLDVEFDVATAQSIGQSYYKAYRDGSKRMLKRLDDAQRRLDARIEEEQVSPDFARIFQQWEDDRHPGRARVWLARHPQQSAALTPEIRNEFARLAGLYQETLCNTETSHLQRAKQHSDLGLVRLRARNLYHNQQLTELENLADAVGKHPERERALPYRHLVEGLIAELQNDPERALDCYFPIIEDNVTALLEDVLLRVAAISLNKGDGQNARVALECLASLSPVFQPQYAEILRMCGDTLAAIDVYNAHLDRFPKNLNAQLKLVRLYIDIDVKDGAKLLLDHILEKDTDNVAALSLAALL